MARLQLLLGDDRSIIHSPSSGVIDTALRTLFSRTESWATLSRGPYDFVTTEGSQEKGLSLEYEMGSADMHNRVKGRLDIDTVIRVFQAYARQEDSWFTDFDWEVVRLNDIDYKRTPQHIVIKPNLLSS